MGFYVPEPNRKAARSSCQLNFHQNTIPGGTFHVLVEPLSLSFLLFIVVFLRI